LSLSAFGTSLKGGEQFSRDTEALAVPAAGRKCNGRKTKKGHSMSIPYYFHSLNF
jgi:hypothetical protein